MYASGIAIGAYLNYLTGISSSWLPNDGIVNTISESGPKLGRSHNNIVDFSGTNPQIGKWNAFEIMYKTDHEDILGRDTSDAMGDLMEFYTDYMEMLQSL
jgi:triacylglycerol lipase